MFKKVDPKQSFPKMEESILKFWEENKVFDKSISQREGAPLYSFYDGPPFATGTPHYGHIVASTMKDAVPRYWTMRGFQVERKWGWDCHGLPIENIAEKELGITHKKEIEKMGVEKFNEVCRSKVLEYVKDWEIVIKRLGRWADMQNSYKTMDLSFMESVWWVFKELWDKDLIYEGYRSMHVCPRCETTLSQSEVAEGYKDIKDLSCIAKFELVDEPGTFVLAWTTTPWTLIGNVALAVGENMEYVSYSDKNIKTGKVETYILERNAFNRMGINAVANNVVIRGKDLVGKKYKPLFDYYYKNEKLENRENGWKIYPADFVTTEDGTGVVHIAPAFGEDDLNLGKKFNLPFVQHLGMDGIIKEEAGEFAGLSVKPKDDHQKTDVEIIKYLAKNNLLFVKEKYEHSYPHCWRCDTPLINFATSSWFVSVLKIKEKMLDNAKKINWVPKHIKEGRFGNWLEGARDWSISRQRYWASVMPIWKCSCGEIKVIGSVKELEDLSGKKITDLHKHIVDEITFKCEKCQGEMKRIPDVLDTWFDSGSMPYAQAHYPFENKEKFDKSFPAQFIAEGIDQTRCWFYYLHVIASGIKNSVGFENVVVNGIVLAEDGKKMSKRLKNYPDPTDIFEKYGADVLRFYLLSSPVMSAENLNFKESDVADLVRGMFRMLWNSYSFFALYAEIDKFQPEKEYDIKNSANLLDKWIISELNVLAGEVNQSMESYELNKVVRLFPGFIDNLSNWYIRRSRKRFWKSENDGDKKQAYETLYYILVNLAKLLAPFCPFIAEEIYKNLTGEESVHLSDFPIADESLIDEKLNEEMHEARVIISLGLQLRADTRKKVRQPLGELKTSYNLSDDFIRMVEDELNVKKVNIYKSDQKEKLENEGWKCIKNFSSNYYVCLNPLVTDDLKLEGRAREVIRAIQEMRKEAGYEVDNRIQVSYSGQSSVFEKFGGMIAKEVLADELKEGEMAEADLKKDLKIEDEAVAISIKKN